MRKIDDGDGLRDCNLGDLLAEFQTDIDYDYDGNIDETEYALIASQYAYIKFGLILEKVRNKCWWRKCSEKFLDFRSFCQTKVNLNIWQAVNAIKSAQVAVNLVFLGFTELPRNASQALKLADLSIDRLGEVWGKVLKSCAAHKITALAIEQQIDPDKESKVTTLRLPKHIAEALSSQARAAGMSLNDYLAELADPLGSDVEETNEVSQSSSIEITEPMLEVLDRCEYQWLKPASDSKKFLDRSIEQFDRIMTDLIGSIVTRPRAKTCTG
jgi:hypothetical protein